MRAVVAALVVQAVALALFIVTVKMNGSVGISRALAPLLSGEYSLTFWLGAVMVGLVVPLAFGFSGGLRRASAGSPRSWRSWCWLAASSSSTS